MTLQLPTDPDSRKAIQDAMEEKNFPNLTIAYHAGWKIVNEWIVPKHGDDGVYEIKWLASNSVTGRIVTFKTEYDEPTTCLETAADYLVTTVLEYLP